MDIQNIILKILRQEVTPAIGCTEPVAVALACAKAKEIADSNNITEINILVSPNIYKNGLGVGIPNTGEIGLGIAAALGVVAGNSTKGLRILENINSTDIDLAKTMVKQSIIQIDIKDTDDKVYVEAIVKTKEDYSKVIITNRHDSFSYLEKSGVVLFKKNSFNKLDSTTPSFLTNLKIKDIIKSIEAMDSTSLEFLLDGIDMNEEIATMAIEKSYGLGVGFSMNKSMNNGFLCRDLLNTATMLTAAGADARMSGLSMPVMSSNGSGNNGLTAILPIAAYNRMYKVDKDRLVKALSISHIINCYIKNQIGRLSALCGCAVSAATGASVAIMWLMDGSFEQIEGVIKNMIANLSGMICDGAKSSCALKVATASSVAIQSVYLALNNSIVLPKNGIVGSSVEDTIKNLGILSNKGMNLTDKVILDIMKKMA